MRLRKRTLSVAAVVIPGLVFSSLFALNCAPDEDTSVSIVTTCDVNSLTTDVPEATVKLYVAAANDAQARAKDIESRFIAVCNKMNHDIGEADGATLSAACNKVAARAEKAIALTPLPPGALPGTVAPWVAIGWEQTCEVDSHALATCYDSCSGTAPCDHDSKCGALVGACAVCNGSCDTRGDDTACTGQCSGACAMPAPPPPDSGIDGAAPSPACAGECVGTCKFPSAWTGRCTAGCNTGFQGQCLGTCTGTCNGTPIGDAGGLDAGSDADAEGGTAPVDAGPPPTGDDGNCAGFCKGQCSSGASGSCATRCTGSFSGGQCTGAGNCVGVCNSVATGCTNTCTGRCRTAPAGGSCTGECDTCMGAVTTSTCVGALDCPANDQCKAVCGVQAALATHCPIITAGELRVAGDSALYTAINNNIGEFATLANELTVVRKAVESVADRTPSDFKSIGLVTDRGFRCVDTGIATMGTARDTLTRATAATNIFRGTQF